MIDIKFLRENPEAVKENIKKKFQDEKIVLVNEVIELDKELRAAPVSYTHLDVYKRQGQSCNIYKNRA